MATTINTDNPTNLTTTNNDGSGRNVWCIIKDVLVGTYNLLCEGQEEPVQHSIDFDICANGADTTYTLAQLKQAAIDAGATNWSWGEAISTATPVNDIQLLTYSQFGAPVCCEGAEFFTYESEASITSNGACSTSLSGGGSLRGFTTQGARDLDDFESVTLQDGTALNVRLAFVACVGGNNAGTKC